MKIHILLATLLFAAPALVSAQNDAKDDPAGNLQKFQQFYRYLNGAYVDTVHNNELVESAIREVLLQLDPHSTYVSPEEMGRSQGELRRQFQRHRHRIQRTARYDHRGQRHFGGPAEQVGLLPNDRIVAVDGKSSVGVKQIDVPKLLRGPKGSRVETRIVRHGGGEPLDFTIVRDNIPINTVDAAYKVDPKTGYIRINRFANNTYKEFTDAVQKLGPMDALILDLRSNGGGLMGGAVQLSNFFLPEGSVIVSTEGMRVPPDRIVAKEDGPFTKGKVIVLINETSASASEIVSGAIQDWDRGLLIGRRTFGKGLVQRQFPLQDGSAVRLTVARYHTPTGRMIQRPYENGNLDAYYEDFNKRFEPGASDSVGGDTTQRFKTLRSGRTVYGGGGITPDIVVPLDTSDYTKYWGSLVRQGVINEFVIEYLDENRPALSSRYAAPEKFVSDFTVSDDVLDALTAKATKKGIAFDAAEFERSKKALKTQLKALIAQKMWGVNEYYLVVNGEDDPVFAKALEVLRDWERYGSGIAY